MGSTTAFGLYDSIEGLQTAVEKFKQEGFEPAALTALLPENPQTRDFAQKNGTTPPYGTASGPTADRDLEGTLGMSTPISGPKAGALRGALRVMGIPEEDAQDYGDLVTDGNALLSVACGDNGDHARALEILHGTGAEKVADGQVADPLSGRPEK